MKEGTLEKLGAGKFSSHWTARKCRLQGQKLIYYRSKAEGKMRGVLDFDLLTCALEVEFISKAGKEKRVIGFRIHVFMSSKVFAFRAASVEEAQDWVKKIQKQISVSKGFGHYLTKVALQSAFWKFDRISQRTLMQTASTGDVILFRSYGFIANFQRCITCSSIGTFPNFNQNIDHIGIVMRFATGELYLLESLGKTVCPRERSIQP